MADNYNQVVLNGNIEGTLHFGIQGPPGPQGPDGGYYVPAVEQTGENELKVSFSPSLPDMPAVDPVQVELPAGPNSGGNVDQNSGLSDSAKALLITILRNAVYSSDQSANITALENALAATGGGDSGGEVEPDVPDEPDTPVEPTEPVYVLASPLTTDGASWLDTEYALADTDKDWTIVCDLTGKPGYQDPAWGLGVHIAMWARSAWCWYCGYAYGNFTTERPELAIVTGNLTNFKTVLIHNKGEETITTYYVKDSALATLTASNVNYSSFVGTADTVTLGGAPDSNGDKFWDANNTINDFKIYERVLAESEIKEYMGVA